MGWRRFKAELLACLTLQVRSMGLFAQFDLSRRARFSPSPLPPPLPGCSHTAQTPSRSALRWRPCLQPRKPLHPARRPCLGRTHRRRWRASVRQPPQHPCRPTALRCCTAARRAGWKRMWPTTLLRRQRRGAWRPRPLQQRRSSLRRRWRCSWHAAPLYSCAGQLMGWMHGGALPCGLAARCLQRQAAAASRCGSAVVSLRERGSVASDPPPCKCCGHFYRSQASCRLSPWLKASPPPHPPPPPTHTSPCPPAGPELCNAGGG